MNRLKPLILAIIASIGQTLTAPAQEIGTWTTHAFYAAPPQKVIDTGRKVYYTSGNSLFGYDKSADESESYTTTNRLNDSSVGGIYYNRAKGYLLVTYESGNLDLLYDDGRTVNISDIKDSSVAPPLTINDVCFTESGFWLATEFGIVEINDERNEVVQSGIYNTPVTALTVIDGNLVIWADGAVRCAPLGNRIPTLASFTRLYDFSAVRQMEPLGDGAMIVRLDDRDNYLSRHEIDFAAGSLKAFQPFARHDKRGMLTRTADGTLVFLADGALWRVGADGRSEVMLASLPAEEFEGAIAGTDKGAEELWTLTREGIACHSIGQSGVSVKMQRHKPEEFSVKEVCYITPMPDGRSLLAYNIGPTNYRFTHYGATGRSIASTVASLDMANGEATDLTPYEVTPVSGPSNDYTRTTGPWVFAPTGVAVDPDDQSKIYVSSILDGVYVVKDGKEIGHFTDKNSPLALTDNRFIAYSVSIDRGGNLWVTTDASMGNSAMHILPASKRKLDPATVKPTDWITLDTKGAGYAGGQDYVTIHMKRSPMTFLADHNQTNLMAAYNNRGTLDTFSDDKLVTVTSMVDQDGNVFVPTYISSFAEDHDGALWIGTSSGVAVISNPASVTDATASIRRVKVPKNDGTNMAEYLLSTDLIMGIAVDAANRKWLATKESGVYLVSADGSRILAHFSPDNSPLPSNRVHCIMADPSSSTIYMGTQDGMLSYASDATPSMEDFSEITVFPNPVTPDYSGPVHIKGLMDGALVKIADASGQVLYQGRSEGGLLTWDACNSAGVRLPSGVYYVFASSGSGDSKSGGTAKFMIIR